MKAVTAILSDMAHHYNWSSLANLVANFLAIMLGASVAVAGVVLCLGHDKRWHQLAFGVEKTAGAYCVGCLVLC